MTNNDGNEITLVDALDRESVKRFRHPSDILEPADQLALVDQLAEVLTPVFLFISRGRLGGTMGVRSWVVLHETRVDLISNESIESYAARVGVDSKRVRVLIDEFRRAVPGYRSSGRRTAADVKKMSEAQQRRRAGAVPLPPGKESFSGGHSSAGSASRVPSTHEGERI